MNKPTVQNLIEFSKYYNYADRRGDYARNYLDDYYYYNPNGYQFACQILESQNATPIIKIYALGSLRNLILKRWDQISQEDRDFYSDYMLKLVYRLSSDAGTDKYVLKNADLALVGLLIQEWPTKYTTFFNELIESSRESRHFCYNSLQIIKFFCEQVLINSDELLSSSQAVYLSNCLQEGAEFVFNFLEEVITSTDDSELNILCLSNLKFFIKWIDSNRIISTKVFEALCNHFLPQPCYVNEILDFIYEFFVNSELQEVYNDIVDQTFNMMINNVNTYIQSQDDFDFNDLNNFAFSRILSITITDLLDKFSMILEKPENVESIQKALKWLLELTSVEDLDVLHTCCNFWLKISSRYQQQQQQQSTQTDTACTEIYAPIFPDILRILIKKMQKPEDIIIYKDKSHDTVIENLQNTYDLMIYSTMKECLVYLTLINQDDIITAIQDMVESISSHWSSEIYQRICWSVGAITSTLDPEKEKTFLTQLLQIQLDMSTNESDPHYRAIIIDGIAHICSQYPNFLQTSPSLLQTVIMKLFDAMHQDYKEMAVISFKKLAEGCKLQFLNKSPESNEPLIAEIIHEYPNIAVDLNPELTIILFDALSSVVSSNPNESEKMRHIELLLEPLNEQWGNFMDNFDPTDPLIVKNIAFVLNCNAAIAFNIGQEYTDQFNLIFPQMMMVYPQLARIINDNVTKKEFWCIGAPLIQDAKLAIINVIENYILKAQNPALALQEYIPQIVETIIINYAEFNIKTRMHKVLKFVTIILTKMQDSIADYLDVIFRSIFISTWKMISDDFTKNTSYRLPFYELLSILVKKYLPHLVSNIGEFTLIVQIIEWGCKHPHEYICEISLDALDDLLNAIDKEIIDQTKDQFLSEFYIEIVYDMFSILTDAYHKFAFYKNVDLLAKLLQINDHLDKVAITEVILDSFPNRKPQQVYDFVVELTNKANNSLIFRQTIQDFLVTTRKLLPKDPDLNREEIEKEKI